MPTSTVCSGSTAGAIAAEARQLRGSPPSSAASGMPCTLPEPLDAGVFMSPCASTQSRPRGCRRACAGGPRPPPPIRRPGCGRRRARSGSAPSSKRGERASGTGAGTPCAISFDVALARVAGSLAFGNGRRDVALVASPQGRGPPVARRCPAMRKADGPMSMPRRLPPRSSGTPMMMDSAHGITVSCRSSRCLRAPATRWWSAPVDGCG